MNILHRFKKPDFSNQIVQGAIVQVYLDESALRMCLKYRLKADEFMKDALLDEIHNKAIINQSTCFNSI
jgi:hypothetical protein